MLNYGKGSITALDLRPYPWIWELRELTKLVVYSNTTGCQDPQHIYMPLLPKLPCAKIWPCFAH